MNIRKIIKEEIDKNELPNGEMIYWYRNATSDFEDMDELDRDPLMDGIKEDFFYMFSKELEGLSYDDKLEVFYNLYL